MTPVTTEICVMAVIGCYSKISAASYINSRDYSQTSTNGHLSIMATSLQRPGFFVPTLHQYIHLTLIETSLQQPPLTASYFGPKVAAVERFNCIFGLIVKEMRSPKRVLCFLRSEGHSQTNGTTINAPQLLAHLISKLCNVISPPQ